MSKPFQGEVVKIAKDCKTFISCNNMQKQQQEQQQQQQQCKEGQLQADPSYNIIS